MLVEGTGSGSEAPASDLEMEASASILTMSGKGAFFVRTISLRVVTDMLITFKAEAFASLGEGAKLLSRRRG